MGIGWPCGAVWREVRWRFRRNEDTRPQKGDGRTQVVAGFHRCRNHRFRKRRVDALFRIGQRLLTSRQLSGQFPNFEAVLPKDNSKSISLHGDELAAAISRVAQFADERSRAVRIRLEKGELKLSASSTETGESEDSLETDYNGEALTIGFNAQYIIDFLKAAGHGDVRLELKDPQSAGQLRPAESEDYKYRYIVMPMRI